MKFKKDSLAPVLITFGIIFSFCSIGCDRNMVLGVMKIIRHLSRDSTDTSSKEKKCNWDSELKWHPMGAAATCLISSHQTGACHSRCDKGKWIKYGYDEPWECAKAAMDCINKRCGHLCKTKK